MDGISDVRNLARSLHLFKSYVPLDKKSFKFDFIISISRSVLIGSSGNWQIRWTLMDEFEISSGQIIYFRVTTP